MKIPKGGNQNPYIEEEQATQWPKEQVQKDNQLSTKHTHKTKDRVTRTPLKTFLFPFCTHTVASLTNPQSCPARPRMADNFYTV